jgi:hypothetical protein
MSETNGWPGKPGVPLNPERDGWHWCERDGGLEPRFWSSGQQLWAGSRNSWISPKMLLALFGYAGPCLTPAEVDARVAQARRDALKKLERHFKEAAAGTPLGHENRQRGASTYNWLIYCASIISALGEKE